MIWPGQSDPGTIKLKYLEPNKAVIDGTDTDDILIELTRRPFPEEAIKIGKRKRAAADNTTHKAAKVENTAVHIMK